MVKSKHKPPSRIRYEESHPTLSCRLDKQTRNLLKQHLKNGELSLSQFIKAQLGVLELKLPDVKKVEKEAYKEGYAKATSEYRIEIKCHKCGKPITIRPRSNIHQAVREWFEGDWHHTNCL